MTREAKISLTDYTLENIKIMAPYLDEASQNQVFGIMLGLIKAEGRVDSNKRASALRDKEMLEDQKAG